MKRNYPYQLPLTLINGSSKDQLSEAKLEYDELSHNFFKIHETIVT